MDGKERNRNLGNSGDGLVYRLRECGLGGFLRGVLSGLFCLGERWERGWEWCKADEAWEWDGGFAFWVEMRGVWVAGKEAMCGVWDRWSRDRIPSNGNRRSRMREGDRLQTGRIEDCGWVGGDQQREQTVCWEACCQMHSSSRWRR
jgi:hypothetical protein